MNTSKKDLYDMLCPDEEQLLAEALAKTDEEVAESLIAKGYDLDTLDRQLIGLVDRLPVRKRTSRGFIVRGAALVSSVGAAGTGVWALITTHAAPVVTAIAVAASVPPLTPEQVIRQDALTACAASQFEVCLAKLDQARDMDPYGESQGVVVDARAKAEQALRRKPDGGVR